MHYLTYYIKRWLRWPMATLLRAPVRAWESFGLPALWQPCQGGLWPPLSFPIKPCPTPPFLILSFLSSSFSSSSSSSFSSSASSPPPYPLPPSKFDLMKHLFMKQEAKEDHNGKLSRVIKEAMNLDGG